MGECKDASFEDEHMALRVGSVFIVLVLSAIGVFFPLLGLKNEIFHIPKIILFAVRFFGSGVIVATAFIHLLGDASEYLSNECLGNGWHEYPWAPAFALMGVWIMFTIELAVNEYVKHNGLKRLDGCSGCAELIVEEDGVREMNPDPYHHRNSLHLHCANSHQLQSIEGDEVKKDEPVAKTSSDIRARDLEANTTSELSESTYRTLVSIFILEFGILFHSVFVGLSLAIAQDEFKTLLVAISFHQFFEGMGLGARFAGAIWPKNQHWVPWALAAGFSLTTPIGVAVGLGVRHSYSEESKSSLLTVGIFNSFCAGILIYNGLVDLMSQDFIHGDFLRACRWKMVAFAYVMLSLGCLLMAFIGKYA